MTTGRPVLLVTSHPPGGVGVGELYMASLASRLRGAIATAALRDRHHADAEAGADSGPLLLNSVRRFEPAWRPVGGWLGEAAARLAVELRLRPHARACLDELARFGERIGADRVIVALDCPTAMLVAEPLARTLGLPLHTLVWDMPEYLLRKVGHGLTSARPCLRAFDAALGASACIAVMSEAMRAEFERRFRRPTVILRQPIDPEWEAGEAFAIRDRREEIVIGFAGSVTARDEVECLLRALDSVGWRLDGRRVTVRVFGLRFVCQAKTARFIEYRGYVESTAEVVRGLADCDVLFLPQPFGASHRLFTEFSFPTKLTTYLAARRPILLCAPEYASLVRHWRDAGIDGVATQRTEADFLRCLSNLIDDGERSVAVLHGMAERDFGAPLFRSRVEAWLDPGVTAEGMLKPVLGDASVRGSGPTCV